MLPEKEEKDFAVWPENWDTVELFLRCQTQWNTSVGGVTGLNYEGVLVVIQIFEYDNPKAVFQDLQIMEAAAIELLNKEKK